VPLHGCQFTLSAEGRYHDFLSSPDVDGHWVGSLGTL
jgi:hypothetical protein